MQAANGVLTCFRSVERLIASEFAGTSGAHHVYLDRIGSAATWSSKIPACQPCAGSFSTPAYLLQLISKHCTYSPAVARQLADNSRTSPAASFRLSSLLLSIPKNTFRQQHGFKTETSAKSLWQQGYNTPGFGYRRSYSIWDGDNILYGLIAANLGGFLLWQSYPGLMYRHATVSVNSVREGRVYTLLTSAFSHNAFNHILANMVTFYFFGRSMSCILGGKKVRPVERSRNLLLWPLQAALGIPSHLATCSCTAAAAPVCGRRACWQSGACDTVLHPSAVHR